MNTAGAKALRDCLSEKVALGQRPEPGGGNCTGPQEGGPGKRDFQAEGPANAKALTWECAWGALEQRKQGKRVGGYSQRDGPDRS